MDAIEAILSALDVEALLDEFSFDKVTHSGDMFRGCCKIHGGDNPSAFVIGEETGLYYCHTCQAKGDIFRLVEVMLDLDFRHALIWLADFTGVDLANTTIPAKRTNLQNELKKFIEFIHRTSKKTTITEYPIDVEVRDIAQLRSFLPSTISHFGVKYVEEICLMNKAGESYTLRQRLLFPILFNNMQVGINLRRVRSKDIPKWSLQPSGLDYGSVLYNYDAVQSAQEVVLCEGLYDVFAFHEIGIPAVATFGAHITNEQCKLLIQLGCDITFGYDGDESGQLAVSKGVGLFKNKATLRCIDIPSGEDPESIDRDMLKLLYESRRRIR